MGRFLTKSGKELLEPTKIVYEIDYKKDCILLPNGLSTSAHYREVNIPTDDKINIIKLVEEGNNVVLKLVNNDNYKFAYLFSAAIYNGSIFDLTSQDLENIGMRPNPGFGVVFSNPYIIEVQSELFFEDDNYRFLINFVGLPT